MWLRNYYNILTAQMLCDDTLTSTTQPTDYTPPVMIHKANNTWDDAAAAHLATGNGSTQTPLYLLPPFTKGSSSYATTQLVTTATPLSLPSTGGGLGFAFGSGATPVTYEDYKLDTAITSGLALVNNAGSLIQPTAYDNVTHHISSVRSFTINNTSSSPITINEFGLYGVYDVSGSCCLIYRDVITPVTLQPGESCIISFTRDAEVYNYTPY